MTRTIAIIWMAGLCGAALSAQSRDTSADQRAADELKLQLQTSAAMTRMALETRVTQGKPYSGDAVTEFVQVLGDGNRIVRKTTARLFRDTDGRTRREEGTEAEQGTVAITDPVAGTSFMLHAATRTATRSPAAFARVEAGTYTVTMSPGARGGGGGGVGGRAGNTKVEIATLPEAELRTKIESTTQVVPGGRGGPTVAFAGGRGGVMIAGAAGGESTKEDLGQQQIEGVTANGTRTTTVIPAGAIGNEQPITIVSEQWFSPDLDVLVLTRHSDPRVGETTYRLTNISRSEPDRSVFQVPADYTVEELRKPPVVWQRQQQ
jgi:hypothetical protein